MATTSYDFDVIRVQGMEEYGPYEVSDEMKSSGWVGGQWVRFKEMRSFRDGESIRWKRIVEPCNDQDPMMFVLRAAYEGTDQFTGRYPQKTGEVTTCNYGQFLFKYFETVNKAERTSPGSGAALTYTLNSNLWVSDRGLLTSEQESGVSSRGVGLCCGLPADNEGYLGVEVLIGPW